MLLAACSGSSENEPAEDAAGFCAQLTRSAGPQSAVDNILIDDPQSVGAAVAELQAIADVAPEELRADLSVIVSAFSAVVAALADADPADRQAVLAPLEDDLAAANEAGERLAAYANQECGLDLGPLPAPGATASPPS